MVDYRRREREEVSREMAAPWLEAAMKWVSNGTPMEALIADPQRGRDWAHYLCSDASLDLALERGLAELVLRAILAQRRKRQGGASAGAPPVPPQPPHQPPHPQATAAPPQQTQAPQLVEGQIYNVGGAPHVYMGGQFVPMAAPTNTTPGPSFGAMVDAATKR